jgi:2-methylcitrate dehydratase PrpD
MNVSATMGLAASYETLNDGATVRNMYTGHSAYMGLLAVRLVECGFTGEHDGVATIYGSVLSEHFDPDQAIAGLGTQWLIAQNYFKLHPTARSLHSAIDALENALETLTDGHLHIDQIQNIVVRTYRLAAAKNNQFVMNSFGAKFSIPFALASILYHGHSGLDCFDEVAVANPAIQSLARMVAVSEDPLYSQRYPSEQCCDVNIMLRNGKMVSGHCRVMKGEPELPNTLEQIHGKFFALGRRVW